MTPLIEVRGLRFQYEDGTQALDGVDFTLERGETVALFGANGSGKTTFVLHLNGILRGEGNISVCGMELSKQTLPQIRAKIGMVFQDSDEQLFMPTVIEDVAFGPLNLGVSQHDAIHQAEAALEQVGMLLAAGKVPYHLSAGVLAMNPEILVLDEPSTFLDPPGHANLVHLLRTLPQSKLIITHDTHFAAALAGRAVFFEKGKLVADGTVEEIVQRFQWSYSDLPADLRYSAQRRF